MTLFEALVALVVLGLTAVGFLAGFQGATRSARDAAAWVEVVGEAEAVMEGTKVGSPAAPLAPGTRLDVQPWADGPGMDVVTVTVELPGGGSFALRRLVRAP